LLELGVLVPAILVARPSKVIKSPYVADVRLHDGTSALAHAPGMELGGVCVPGAQLLLSRNGSSKAKTAYAIQLVGCDEAECGVRRPTWVGASPLLANRLCAAALERGLLAPVLGPHTAVRPEATVGDMRVDFLVTNGASTTLLEVKSVVCADYAPDTVSDKPKRYQLIKGVAPYHRAAVFPVGVRGQKLDDGRAVVSERAIKHARELAALTTASTRGVFMFVVNRGDCARLLLRGSSCPIFGEEVAQAVAKGIAVYAFRVRWEGDGRAFFEGMLGTDAGAGPARTGDAI